MMRKNNFNLIMPLNNFLRRGLGNPRGQIATLIVLVLTVAVVLLAVTLNIGRLALNRTLVSNAADGTALFLSSMCGSLAHKLSVEYAEGGDEKCETNFGLIFKLFLYPLLIASSLIPGINAITIPLAVGMGLDIAVDMAVVMPETIKSVNSAFIQDLSFRDQYVQHAIFFGLTNTVTDGTESTVPDADRWGTSPWGSDEGAEMNVEAGDPVGRFAKLWYEHCKWVKTTAENELETVREGAIEDITDEVDYFTDREEADPEAAGDFHNFLTDPGYVDNSISVVDGLTNVHYCEALPAVLEEAETVGDILSGEDYESISELGGFDISFYEEKHNCVIGYKYVDRDFGPDVKKYVYGERSHFDQLTNFIYGEYIADSGTEAIGFIPWWEDVLDGDNWRDPEYTDGDWQHPVEDFLSEYFTSETTFDLMYNNLCWVIDSEDDVSEEEDAYAGFSLVRDVAPLGAYSWQYLWNYWHCLLADREDSRYCEPDWLYKSGGWLNPPESDYDYDAGHRRSLMFELYGSPKPDVGPIPLGPGDGFGGADWVHTDEGGAYKKLCEFYDYLKKHPNFSPPGMVWILDPNKDPDDEKYIQVNYWPRVIPDWDATWTDGEKNLKVREYITALAARVMALQPKIRVFIRKISDLDEEMYAFADAYKGYIEAQKIYKKLTWQPIYTWNDTKGWHHVMVSVDRGFRMPTIQTENKNLGLTQCVKVVNRDGNAIVRIARLDTGQSEAGMTGDAGQSQPNIVIWRFRYAREGVPDTSAFEEVGFHHDILDAVIADPEGPAMAQLDGFIDNIKDYGNTASARSYWDQTVTLPVVNSAGRWD